MSRQFRTTFSNIFLPKSLKRKFSNDNKLTECQMEMDSKTQMTQMTQLWTRDLILNICFEEF